MSSRGSKRLVVDEIYDEDDLEAQFGNNDNSDHLHNNLNEFQPNNTPQQQYAHAKYQHHNVNNEEDDDDDDELMGDKDIQKLNSLWRVMKEEKKQQLNISSGSAHNHSRSFGGGSGANGSVSKQSQWEQRSTPRIQSAQQNHQQLSRNKSASQSEYQDEFEQQQQQQQQQQHQLQEGYMDDEYEMEDQYMNERQESNSNEGFFEGNKRDRIAEVKLQESYNLLNRAQEKNSTLIRKLADAEDELDKAHMKISKLSQMQLASAALTPVTGQQSRMASAHKAGQQQQTQQMTLAQLQQRSPEQYTLGLLQGDSEEKDKVLKQLSLSLEEYQDKCSLLLSENAALRERNAIITKELDAKIAENSRIRSKLAEVEVVINEIILEKNSKGVAMLEIEYLKNDVEKLLQLLGNTTEYKEFFRFAKDSRDIRNLKYIPKIANTKQDSEDRVIKVPINQKMLWVPRDAFSLALHLKQKYHNKLDEKCIEELLFGYNKIFAEREDRAQERLKKIYQTQINALRLELDKKTSYKQVATTASVQRRGTKKPNTTAISSKSQTQLPLDRQINDLTRLTEQNKENQLFLTDALKLQEEYERQLVEKSETIELLKLQVQSLQSDALKYDQINYVEGTLWMADKVIKEVSRFRDSLIEMAQQLDHSSNARDVIQSQKWFNQNVETNAEHLLKKITHMRDSAQKQTPVVPTAVKVSPIDTKWQNLLEWRSPSSTTAIQQQTSSVPNYLELLAEQQERLRVLSNRATDNPMEN